MPSLLGWDDDGQRPLMVLEDLSGATWPSKWTSDTITAVLNTLATVKSTHPPDGLPTLESMRKDFASY